MPFENTVAIYCADIGSEKRGRFGWAGLRRDEPMQSGDSLAGLVAAVAAELNAGRPVALGFECPLFVPITKESNGLTTGRIGESSRAWCASAGASALATGLTQVVWILERVHELMRVRLPATVDWPEFVDNGRGLFLWEAFVTGAAKGETHLDDAELGARAFQTSLPDPTRHTAIDSHSVHSLIGAALLRAGWSERIELLSEPCVVIRA